MDLTPFLLHLNLIPLSIEPGIIHASVRERAHAFFKFILLTGFPQARLVLW